MISKARLVRGLGAALVCVLGSVGLASPGHAQDTKQDAKKPKATRTPAPAAPAAPATAAPAAVTLDEVKTQVDASVAEALKGAQQAIAGAVGQARKAAAQATYAANREAEAKRHEADVAADDLQAAQWWAVYGRRALARYRDLAHDRRLKFLVFLPSGAQAFPSYAAVTEGSKLQVLVISSTAHPAALKWELVANSCADLQAFRPKPQAAAAPGGGDYGVLGAPMEEQYQVMPVGQIFSCGAGTATYSLTSDGVAQTNTIKFRPKYHLAASALLGYDTGKQETADVAAGKVQTHRDTTGLAAYVGATWMMGGVDYGDMRCWNHYANLFLAVNPTSPTQDAIAGFALTATGGVSLALGLSLHKRKIPNGYAAGDPWSGDGNVPTRSTWSGVHPGVFIGVAVDSNLFSAMKNANDSK